MTTRLVVVPNLRWAKGWARERGLDPRPGREWHWLRTDEDVWKFRPGPEVELHVLGWPEGLGERYRLREAILARGMFECEV